MANTEELFRLAILVPAETSMYLRSYLGRMEGVVNLLSAMPETYPEDGTVVYTSNNRVRRKGQVRVAGRVSLALIGWVDEMSADTEKILTDLRSLDPDTDPKRLPSSSIIPSRLLRLYSYASAIVSWIAGSAGDQSATPFLEDGRDTFISFEAEDDLQYVTEQTLIAMECLIEFAQYFSIPLRVVDLFDYDAEHDDQPGTPPHEGQ